MRTDVIYHGDCTEILKSIPDSSIDLCFRILTITILILIRVQIMDKVEPFELATKVETITKEGFEQTVKAIKDCLQRHEDEIDLLKTEIQDLKRTSGKLGR